MKKNGDYSYTSQNSLMQIKLPINVLNKERKLKEPS